MDSMVIIGAGECGTRAAFALREAGWTGPVTLIGAEPGLPYERPPLSKPQDGAVQRKPICGADALAAAGIDYRPGSHATALDPQSGRVTLSDGRMLSYHRLLIATGARPRRLACPRAERALDFRSHADALAVFAGLTPGTAVTIIGAGLIGMELASVLAGKGLAVAVIEAGPAALARAVPPHFAARLTERHRAEGVTLHLGQSVTEIGQQGVTLGSGVTVPAARVISAIGVLPDVALAQAAGLATGNGILTDARLQTSAPNVFAAGDCAAVAQPDGSHLRQESWRSARAQAECAARAMLGAGESPAALPWFWSDQYDLGLQVAGLPQPGHDQILRRLPGAEIGFYLDAGRLVAAAGLGTGNAVARDIKLAEMLIAAGARPEPALLADPAVGLKALLKSAQAA